MEVEKGTEFTNRGSIFKQMAEMKKKIQLVEGKTYFIYLLFYLVIYSALGWLNMLQFSDINAQVKERQFLKIVNPKKLRTKIV